MSYLSQDEYPISTLVATSSMRAARRSGIRFGPGGGRSDSITMESPLPESAPDDDVHFDGGVVAMSFDTPGQPPARGHSPYFTLPETDYGMASDYREPWGDRQAAYPKTLNARGYIYGRTGMRQLPNYGLGFVMPDAGAITAAAERGAVAAQAKAAPSGDSFLSVLKGIIPAVTDAGKGIFTAYSEGRAAVKQAKMSMAGETNDDMTPPPAAAPALPSWVVPAGVAALGLGVIWKLMK